MSREVEIRICPNAPGKNDFTHSFPVTGKPRKISVQGCNFTFTLNGLELMICYIYQDMDVEEQIEIGTFTRLCLSTVQIIIKFHYVAKVIECRSLSITKGSVCTILPNHEINLADICGNISDEDDDDLYD